MPNMSPDGRYSCTLTELHALLEGFGAALIDMATVSRVSDVADAVARALIDNALQAWHMDASSAPCHGPDPCNHTDLEHAAFDAGMVAGDYGLDADTCPLDDEELREAWLCGHSVTYVKKHLTDFRLLCANHHYELTLTHKIEGTDITQ